MAKESGVSPLAGSLPQGGGDVRGLGGSFVPDFNRGTGSYQIDLKPPPGYANFSPPLGLSYNSGGSNGVFGLGWSISIPVITRKGEGRFIQYNDSDPILLDEHGELVRLYDGSFRPKFDSLFATLTVYCVLLLSNKACISLLTVCIFSSSTLSDSLN